MSTPVRPVAKGAGVIKPNATREIFDAHQNADPLVHLPSKHPLQGRGDFMYNKILICNDGSSLSKRAVTHALQLAKLMDAEVLILKVIPRVIESHFDGAMALRATEIARIEKSWAKAAHEVVDQDQVKAQKMGLKAQAMVAKSDIIYKAIIEVATKKKADLIVMASHGRQGIQKLILGSETQNVLTHSKIPVLVLR